MSASSIRSATTAICRRSPRNFGISLPTLGAPTWCPARPIRCSPLATDSGASTWTTRSTVPMSIPSSSDDVATIAGSHPPLSASSTPTRCSRASEPWWARAISSPASSFRLDARRSALRRLLTNTIVVRCARISSSSTGWIEGQIDERSTPPAGVSLGRENSVMSSTGTITSRSSCLRTPASTIATSRWRPGSANPPRNRAISSSGRWVADSPIRCTGRPVSASRRSSDSIRCAPRFVAATEWISSRITVSTPRSVSRAEDVSSR